MSNQQQIKKTSQRKLSLFEKLSEARKIIAQTQIKKLGHNGYSNYDYFTPEQVEELVESASRKVRILPIFELIRNEIGLYGKLTIYDLDSSAKIELQQATAIPQIKATNIAQQIGGAVTYTQRYMLSSAFGITENAFDFDGQNNQPQQNNNIKLKQKNTNIEIDKELQEQRKVLLHKITAYGFDTDTLKQVVYEKTGLTTLKKATIQNLIDVEKELQKLKKNMNKNIENPSEVEQELQEKLPDWLNEN